MNKRFLKSSSVKSVPRMSSDLYPVRRRVINALYEARDLLGGDLPRLGVRVVETKECVNGIALVGGREFMISTEAAGWTDEEVRRTVWHEIAHAVFGAEHVAGCPLMSPTRPNIIAPREALAKAFLAVAGR